MAVPGLNTFCADPEHWAFIVIHGYDDVDRLNDLFDNGWHLVQVDVEGLPFLAFNSLRSTLDVNAPKPPEGADSGLLLILQRDDDRAQHARVFDRNEEGYLDFRSLDIPPADRRWVGMFPIDRQRVLLVTEGRHAST